MFRQPEQKLSSESSEELFDSQVLIIINNNGTKMAMNGEEKYGVQMEKLCENLKKKISRKTNRDIFALKI